MSNEVYKDSGIKKIVINQIIQIAKDCDINKVILFGSRARGDYKERSDIDIAFYGNKGSDFSLKVDEETSTLLRFDIVDMSLPISKELLNSIKTEGICIYEKYDNFVNALTNLHDIYNYDEPYGNVEMTGLVGLFEICFEQAWKAMKESLDNSGFDESKTGSPRQLIKTAYQARMINEEVWLNALVSRNNVSHSYNREIAMDIIMKTKNQYYDMFVNLKDALEKDWAENIQE